MGNLARKFIREEDIRGETLSCLRDRVIDCLGVNNSNVLDMEVDLRRSGEIHCKKVEKLIKDLVETGAAEGGELLEEIKKIKDNIEGNRGLKKRVLSRDASMLIVKDYLKKNIMLTNSSVGKLLSLYLEQGGGRVDELLELLQRKVETLSKGNIHTLLNICERADLLDLDFLFRLLGEKVNDLESGSSLNNLLGCVINSEDPEKYKSQIKVYRDKVLLHWKESEKNGLMASTLLKVSWFLGDLEKIKVKDNLEVAYRGFHEENLTAEDEKTKAAFEAIIRAIRFMGYSVDQSISEYLFPGISADRMIQIGDKKIIIEWDHPLYHREDTGEWNQRTKSKRALAEKMKVPLIYFSPKDLEDNGDGGLSESFKTRLCRFLKDSTGIKAKHSI